MGLCPRDVGRPNRHENERFKPENRLFHVGRRLADASDGSKDIGKMLTTRNKHSVSLSPFNKWTNAYSRDLCCKGEHILLA